MSNTVKKNEKKLNKSPLTSKRSFEKARATARARSVLMEGFRVVWLACIGEAFIIFYQVSSYSDWKYFALSKLLHEIYLL